MSIGVHLATRHSGTLGLDLYTHNHKSPCLTEVFSPFLLESEQRGEMSARLHFQTVEANSGLNTNHLSRIYT